MAKSGILKYYRIMEGGRVMVSNVQELFETDNNALAATG
ncbi:hypothetical protein LSH36_473g00014, partial [Paralvinella palmiformis]